MDKTSLMEFDGIFNYIIITGCITSHDILKINRELKIDNIEKAPREG